MKIEVKKILCPVDFSETSEHAVPYAAALAEKFGAEVVFLHVLELPTIAAPSDGIVPGVGMGIPPELMKESIERSERAADERLERMVEEILKKYDCLATPNRRSGRPFAEIAAAAKELPADLIVIGTHGRTGLPHILMGSTAERVIRMAPCPVLTVKHPEREFVA